MPVLGRRAVAARPPGAGRSPAMIGGSLVALAGILSARFDLGGVPTEIYAALVSAVLFVAVSLMNGKDG